MSQTNDKLSALTHEFIRDRLIYFKNFLKKQSVQNYLFFCWIGGTLPRCLGELFTMTRILSLLSDNEELKAKLRTLNDMFNHIMRLSNEREKLITKLDQAAGFFFGASEETDIEEARKEYNACVGEFNRAEDKMEEEIEQLIKEIDDIIDKCLEITEDISSERGI